MNRFPPTVKKTFLPSKNKWINWTVASRLAIIARKKSWMSHLHIVLLGISVTHSETNCFPFTVVTVWQRKVPRILIVTDNIYYDWAAVKHWAYLFCCAEQFSRYWVLLIIYQTYIPILHAYSLFLLKLLYLQLHRNIVAAIFCRCLMCFINPGFCLIVVHWILFSRNCRSNVIRYKSSANLVCMLYKIVLKIP